MDTHRDITDFQSEVLELSKRIPVLVDFWAEWCGPCKILGPVLERLAAKHEGQWELKKLNTEEFPDVAGQYDIRSIPNVKLFVNGEVVNEFVGALPETSIERWLQSALPDRHAAELDLAEQLLRQQDYEQARTLLEPIVSQSQDHERGRVLLATALLSSDRKRSLQLLESIDASSKYFELADAVRSMDQLLLKSENPESLPEAPVRQRYAVAINWAAEGKYDEALEEFISVIREDRYYDDDGARKACIAIFKYLGEEHEVTLRHRREFGNALFA